MGVCNSFLYRANLTISPFKKCFASLIFYLLNKVLYCITLHCTLLHCTAQHCTAPRRRAGQGRAGQGRAGQGRAGQGRAGQGRAGQGRAGRGRAGQGTAPHGTARHGTALYCILILHPRNKLHAISSFSGRIICAPQRGSFCGSESFAVQFGDHFRSGIIRGALQPFFRVNLTSNTESACEITRARGS